MSKDYKFLPTTGETLVYLSMVRLMLKRLAHEQIHLAFQYRQSGVNPEWREPRKEGFVYSL